MTNALGSHGTILEMSDMQTTPTWAAIAEVVDITGPSLSMGSHEAISQTSGWMERVPGILDGGEFTFDLNFIPDDSTHDNITGLISVMTARQLTDFRMTFTDSSSTVWSFSAYVTKFEPSAPADGLLSASVTLSISGEPTIPNS